MIERKKKAALKQETEDRERQRTMELEEAFERAGKTRGIPREVWNDPCVRMFLPLTHVVLDIHVTGSNALAAFRYTLLTHSYLFFRCGMFYWRTRTLLSEDLPQKVLPAAVRWRARPGLLGNMMF